MGDDTYYLVEPPKGMARWCRLVPGDAPGSDEWMDAKGRCWPRAAGRPIAHVEGGIEATLEAPPVILHLVRGLAQRHLLDPWSCQGWLAPNGSFYGCAFYAHDDVAHALLGKRVGELEGLGYVRVHADSFRTSDFGRARGITVAQRRTLTALGFDVDGHARRMPHEPDRGAPPPRFAVRPSPGWAPVPSQPEPDPPVDAGAVAPVIVRLSDDPALAALLDGEEPEVIPDMGGGYWSWSMYMSRSELHVGSGDHPRAIVAAEGIHLSLAAWDQVEMTPWHEPGIVTGPGVAELLESLSARAAPRP